MSSTERGHSLTAKQRRFVAEYLVDFNATQASVRAGYSVRTARVIGPENLSKPAIAAAIEAGRAELARKAEMDAVEWRQRLTRIARFDVRRLFCDGGQLLPMHALPDAAALCIGKIKVMRERTRIVGGDEAGASVTEESVIEVQPHEVLRSLEMLGKSLGVLKDTVRHEGIEELEAALRAGRERVAAAGEQAPA